MPWPRELMRRGENDDNDDDDDDDYDDDDYAVRPGETSWSQHLRGIPRFRRVPQPAQTFRNCRNEPWNARLYAIKLRMMEGISAGLFRLIVQTTPLHPGRGYSESFLLRIAATTFPRMKEDSSVCSFLAKVGGSLVVRWASSSAITKRKT